MKRAPQDCSTSGEMPLDANASFPSSVDQVEELNSDDQKSKLPHFFCRTQSVSLTIFLHINYLHVEHLFYL